MAANEFFGFDTTQKAALARLKAELLAEIAAQTGAVADDLTDLTTYATNLNTWAVALATKLNADSGVNDTDYDTNPQA